MQLNSIPVFENIDPYVFKDQFYNPQKPVVIKSLANNGRPTPSGTGIILNS
jgi:hypothetical protein